MYKPCFPLAALIDMDGTLYDSMVNHTAAWSRLAAEEGMPTPREEFYLFEGRTGKSTLDILFQRHRNRHITDEEAAALYAKKTRYFRELPPVAPMPGALKLMEAFKCMGIKRVLVTGSGQSSLISRLYEDYPGIFRPELRITSADVKHGKPDPEPYQMAMQKAFVQPWQAVAIENAPLGVESAARSGAFTVGVTTGPISSRALLESGADIVYKSMEQCAEMLPRLLLQLYSSFKSI